MVFSNKIYPHAFLEFLKQNIFFLLQDVFISLTPLTISSWLVYGQIPMAQQIFLRHGWISSPDVGLNKAMLAGLTS